MKHPTPHHELDLDAPASQGRHTAVLLQNIELKFTYLGKALLRYKQLLKALD